MDGPRVQVIYFNPASERRAQSDPSLVGIATVGLADFGLLLSEVRIVTVGNQRLRVQVPRQFAFASSTAYGRFSRAVIEAVRATFPDALPPAPVGNGHDVSDHDHELMT